VVERLEPEWGLIDSSEHGLFELPGAKESQEMAQGVLEDMFTKNTKITHDAFRHFCAKVKMKREKELFRAGDAIPVDLADLVQQGRGSSKPWRGSIPGREHGRIIDSQVEEGLVGARRDDDISMQPAAGRGKAGREAKAQPQVVTQERAAAASEEGSEEREGVQQGSSGVAGSGRRMVPRGGYTRSTDRIMAHLSSSEGEEADDEGRLVSSPGDVATQREVDEALFSYESMVHLRFRQLP